MQRLAPALAVALALTAAACGPGAVAPSASKPTAALDLGALTIPPSEGAAAVLAELERRAAEGDADAGWQRVHYLLDLFDDARFRGADDSRRALAAALDLDADARGAAATDAAIARLTAEADRVLAAERLHPGAQGARVLLELDAERPTRESLYQRSVAQKTLARASSEVADNAILRLAGLCHRALDDAATAPPRDQGEILAHCLYPLYDADPAPYFAANPADRPPPPAPRDLIEGSAALLEGVDDDRLAAAAASQREAVLAIDPASFATAPDPIAAALPPVAGAVPYDGAPRLELGDGRELDSAEVHAESLARPVAGDGRGTVAVALAAHAPATALLTAGRAAVLAGADELAVLVATEQRLDAPPGDYWHDRLTGGRVPRLGVVPLSLAPLGADPAANPRRAGPRATRWDPSRATLGLHLVVGVSTWRLVGDDGEVARVDSSTTDRDPGVALRRALEEIRAAFPDEDGLVVVPAKGSTLAALIAAATAAATGDRGQALFSRLALGDKAPSPKRRGLRRRIDRRAGATVAIVPDALQPRAAVARACYQDALEKSPKLAGTLRLERRGEVVEITAGPRDRRLRACALEAVGAALRERDIASAELSFSPTAPPAPASE